MDIETELCARIAVLEARETELQAKGTKLETERRMWKARYEAIETVMRTVVIDVPILCRLAGPEEDQSDIKALLADAYGVAKRIDLLERDAWTMVGGLVREFVKDTRVYLDSRVTFEERGSGTHEKLILWFKRFSEAIPPE